MSLHPDPVGPVPEETARVARAAFPKGTLYLSVRGELGALYDDSLFADLFPHRGQPAEAPCPLALGAGDRPAVRREPARPPGR